MENKNYKIRSLTGNFATAEAMRQIDPDVVAAYPITPQSGIVERFSEFVADGKVNTEFIPVESEHSAMSACVGASSAGARVMTATSSQGLALMWEIVSVASGLRLPIVMAVVDRALSAPINIHCDHSDCMGARDLGWIQIFSENPQEAYENVFLALRLAESVSLPVMVMQDGYVTSHCVERVKVYDDEAVRNFIGERKPEHPLLDIKNPVTLGPLQLQDYFFETKRQEAEAMELAKREYIKIGNELSKMTGNKYDCLDAYMVDDADAVIVTMSSTAGTTRAVVKKMRERGKKVGLLKIRLYRPFMYERVAGVLKGKTVGVLDRSLSFGALPPLFADIKNSLPNEKMQSYVFGLGGRNIFESDIEKVFDELLKGKTENEIKYIGLRE